MAGADDRVARLADLVVGVGANVQAGQIVGVTAFTGMEEIVRATAAAAYRRGARWVDVLTFDRWVKRARVDLAPDDSLDFTPPWMIDRLEWLSREHGARITLAGPSEPAALEGVDPSRAGRDQLPYLPNSREVTNARTINWCVAPAPTRGWARHVFPELPPEAAYDRLWDEVGHVCRLDEPDPGAAWHARARELRDAADRLTQRRFDAVHLRGAGTDLTVGLLESSTWLAGGSETVTGVRHLTNIPTEEVFTTPDPARVDGVVTATRPLVLWGTFVEGVRIEFAGGRAVRIDADRGGDALRAAAARDEGASRLGELALVDGSGRIGPLGTVFWETLIDENAVSHLALGGAYHAGVGEHERSRANASRIHVDFMVGSPTLDVDGITPSGQRVPLLRNDTWQL
jgi:aminopeptidase